MTLDGSIFTGPRCPKLTISPEVLVLLGAPWKLVSFYGWKRWGGRSSSVFHLSHKKKYDEYLMSICPYSIFISDIFMANRTSENHEILRCPESRGANFIDFLSYLSTRWTVQRQARHTRTGSKDGHLLRVLPVPTMQDTQIFDRNFFWGVS